MFNEPQIKKMLSKLNRFANRIEPHIFEKKDELTGVEFFHTDKQLHAIPDTGFAPAEKGMKWSGESTYCWFKSTYTVPAELDAGLIAALVQGRINTLTEIPAMVDFFAALPEYGVELFSNKKNKLTPESSKVILEQELAAVEAIQDWSYDAIHDALYGLAEKMAEEEGTKLDKMVGKVM